ncbi:hypothetical protein BC835DRAFT_1415176 [Cytidiella melzeri]|nr:hypothetical protein BC835DRAFT_1415176 [Cytidiella melzeri]
MSPAFLRVLAGLAVALIAVSTTNAASNGITLSNKPCAHGNPTLVLLTVLSITSASQAAPMPEPVGELESRGCPPQACKRKALDM